MQPAQLLAPPAAHVSSTDEAPIVDRSTYPLYPHELAKPVWRQKLRLALDLWRVRHTDHSFRFPSGSPTSWSTRLRRAGGAVHPLHVGLDLDL